MARFLLFVLVCTPMVVAQPSRSRFELSASGNAGSVRLQTDVTTEEGGGSYSSSESYGAIALRAGVFIVRGLEFEPECIVTAQEGRKGAYTFSANVAYNFSIPRSPAMPFILVGYGTGNAIPRFGRTTDPLTTDPKISVLNVGAGIKFMMTRSVALRGEYRFQMYDYTFDLQEPTIPVMNTHVRQRWYFNDVYAGLSFFF